MAEEFGKTNVTGTATNERCRSSSAGSEPNLADGAHDGIAAAKLVYPNLNTPTPRITPMPGISERLRQALIDAKLTSRDGTVIQGSTDAVLSILTVVLSDCADAITDDELAGWARSWHWNDCADDKPVDPSIYFRDVRMLKAFVEKCRALPAPPSSSAAEQREG